LRLVNVFLNANGTGTFFCPLLYHQDNLKSRDVPCREQVPSRTDNQQREVTQREQQQQRNASREHRVTCHNCHQGKSNVINVEMGHKENYHQRREALTIWQRYQVPEYWQQQWSPQQWMLQYHDASNNFQVQ